MKLEGKAELAGKYIHLLKTAVKDNSEVLVFVYFHFVLPVSYLSSTAFESAIFFVDLMYKRMIKYDASLYSCLKLLKHEPISNNNIII